MTQRKPSHKKTHPVETIERSHLIRAFWRVELEPIIGRSADGTRIVTNRAEGSVKIRIDSPDADAHSRDIAFRAMAYGGQLFILGIGKGSTTKNDDGGEFVAETDLSIAALPKNIMEFFMDLRKAIETRWSSMQDAMDERMMRAEGIVGARFRFKVSRYEQMQMNLIETEEEKCDGKGETYCGSVRKLRETVE